MSSQRSSNPGSSNSSKRDIFKNNQNISRFQAPNDQNEVQGIKENSSRSLFSGAGSLQHNNNSSRLIEFGSSKGLSQRSLLSYNIANLGQRSSQSANNSPGLSKRQKTTQRSADQSPLDDIVELQPNSLERNSTTVVIEEEKKEENNVRVIQRQGKSKKDEMRLVDESKKFITDKLSVFSLLVFCLWLLILIYSPENQKGYEMFHPLSNILKLEPQHEEFDQDDLESYFTSVGTVSNAWEKAKSLLENIVFNPGGQLYSTRYFFDCSSKELDDKKAHLLFLGSFNQVLGVSFQVESSTDDEINMFFQGVYLEDSEVEENQRKLEEWDDSTNTIRKISLVSVFYNDNTGIMGVLLANFNVERSGSLGKSLEFRSFYPFSLFGNHEANYKDLGLFISAIITGVVSFVVTFKLGIVLFL